MKLQLSMRNMKTRAIMIKLRSKNEQGINVRIEIILIT